MFNRLLLGVLAAALSLLGAGAAQAQTTVWSATLVVDRDGSGFFFGCDDRDSSQDNCSAVLSTNAFTYESTTYEVEQFYWFRAQNPADRTVVLGLKDLAGSQHADAIGPLTLMVDGQSFAVSDSSTGARVISWPYDPTPGWTEEQTVRLALIDPFGEPPAEPPMAPEAPEVTAGNGRLGVAWSPPADEGTHPVTGYNLGYRPAEASDWTVLDLVAGDYAVRRSGGIHYRIDGLDNGTLYEVRVRAVSDAGAGPWSPTAGGMPLVRWFAPYLHGTGGFVVRPADGRSARVRLVCGGRRRAGPEYAGDDGLIVRDIQTCVGEDGRPLLGDLTFEGIEDGGWYWINGDRNVAVAPLVVETSLDGELRPPVAGGVTASPTGDALLVREYVGRHYGTLMVHEGNGLMGIIPHLADMEGDGAHAAPYWKGRGGIVGRPLDGESAVVRLSCGDGGAETHTLEPGEDGTIVTLLPAGCFDSGGNPIAGGLEADGFEDGAWYWINGPVPFAAPLVGRERGEDALTVPLIPEGVEAEEGLLGTLFVRGNLTGVVPRVRTAPP